MRLDGVTVQADLLGEFRPGLVGLALPFQYIGQESVDSRDRWVEPDRLAVKSTLLIRLALGSEDIAEVGNRDQFLRMLPETLAKNPDSFFRSCGGLQEACHDLHGHVSITLAGEQEGFTEFRDGLFDPPLFSKQGAEEEMQWCKRSSLLVRRGASDLQEHTDGLLRPSIERQVETELVAPEDADRLERNGLPVFLDRVIKFSFGVHEQSRIPTAKRGIHWD